MRMIEITPEMMTKAENRAHDMGCLKGSFMEGGGNIVGMLGEVCFETLWPKAYHPKTFDYDYLMPNGSRVDVKSRIVGVDPKPDFDFTMPMLNHGHQSVDWYAFFCIHKSFCRAWYVGKIHKINFDRVCQVTHQGDEMPQGDYYRADGLKIYINQLEVA